MIDDSTIHLARKRGRPCKGVRSVVRGRIDFTPPIEVAAQLRQLAHRRNLSMTALLTDLIAEAYRSV